MTINLKGSKTEFLVMLKKKQSEPNHFFYGLRLKSNSTAFSAVWSEASSDNIREN